MNNVTIFYYFRQLLLGLACNENTAELELDISSNGLGQSGAHVLESCLHGIKCLCSLDISDNSELILFTSLTMNCDLILLNVQIWTEIWLKW